MREYLNKPQESRTPEELAEAEEDVRLCAVGVYISTLFADGHVPPAEQVKALSLMIAAAFVAKGKQTLTDDQIVAKISYRLRSDLKFMRICQAVHQSKTATKN